MKLAQVVEDLEAEKAQSKPVDFGVRLFGTLDSAEMPSKGLYYAKYEIIAGPDWIQTDGRKCGITQVASFSGNKNTGAVWGFPLEASYKSTNVYGWPRVVISVYGFDFMNRDVLCGYGSALLKCQPDVPIRIQLFRPMASSFAKWLLGSIKGSPAEFVDSKFIGQPKNREKVKVQSFNGFVTLKVNMFTSNVKTLGYQF